MIIILLMVKKITLPIFRLMKIRHYLGRLPSKYDVLARIFILLQKVYHKMKQIQIKLYYKRALLLFIPICLFIYRKKGRYITHKIRSANYTENRPIFLLACLIYTCPKKFHPSHSGLGIKLRYKRGTKYIFCQLTNRKTLFM